MAALHWEAQRKQGVVDKRSKFEQERQEQLKLLQEQNQKELQERQARQGSSYEKQLKKLISQSGRCPRGEYHQNRDVERRQEFYESTKGDHSAKIQLRYNDINFAQQW
ncbi:uncharacterized protein LOC119741186 [Patiria miniata]|uniref:Uncharacterized protein n=1 Tax=Patiria miniata TaxID=46514 RepID=A0A914BA09_PATMI|nr:uncharacterized protein LOC119741186 [Patiria miniata]XP_038072829.1 uncharacterized protein LOC119741186 [Patiria miniata]XP_038072830.1 uncharacterized protein LOC119741186 [Patiria miniata]